MPEMPEPVLSFATQEDGDQITVRCKGRLVAGSTTEFFQEVKRLLPQTKVLKIDLAELLYVDSTGLGTLVRLYTSGRQHGCTVQLLHLGQQLRNLLKLTNLLAVFAQAENDSITIA